MKRKLIIAGLAGMLASLAVPLPRGEPVNRAAKKLSGPAPRRTAKPAAPVVGNDWPVDAASIAKLSASECGEELDKILRHCACTLPDGETLDAAVALTLRLTDLSAAVNPEHSPLRGRQLPSWLLHRMTGSLLQRSSTLPAGWMAAVAQSAAGREAMLSLTTELSVSSPDKAKALAAAGPAPWREALSAKVREGLAVRDPVAAAREAWESAAPFSAPGGRFDIAGTAGMLFAGSSPLSATPRDNLQEILMVSSRRGPVKEAVAALTLYSESEPGDTRQQRMLANLWHRDPAGTRAAVEESGDPALQKVLAKAEQLPAEASSSVDLTAELRKNPDELNPSVRHKAWQALAALNSDEAASLLRPAGGDPDRMSVAIGMAATDPARAFAWAKTNASASLMSVFKSWVQSDGPAALNAVWALPPDDRFRGQIERIAREPDDLQWAFGGSSREVWADVELPWKEIRAAARYAKLPDAPSAPAVRSPRNSTPGSPLWSDGPLPGK